ncbi:hypothetical protein SADUNF_Sadunf08G0025000 [Salix dunnii]|uniref:Uncharacterized protein n=1 Tax=Salix dunnii TaxID=1413687 RepID=A0A835JSG5_9ROSI|nr:hypothetical protein SADUNF_Sadunf08G0025000 [Salix dunnii]
MQVICLEFRSGINGAWQPKIHEEELHHHPAKSLFDPRVHPQKLTGHRQTLTPDACNEFQQEDLSRPN